MATICLLLYYSLKGLSVGKFCPYIKKDCRDDCVFFRRGLRYFDDKKKEPEPFEECAINVMADSLENIIMRTVGQQAAIEGLRNEVTALNSLFFGAMKRKNLEGRDGRHS